MEFLIGFGEWLLTSETAILIIGIIFFAVALVCQLLINKSLDEAVGEMNERLTEIEKVLKTERSMNEN